MAASVQQINVASKEELESATMSYIAQGFSVTKSSPESVTLFKKKEFNVIWAVIGFFLCLLPLLVYCIVYATQDDQMVVIRIASISTSATPGLGAASGVTWSEDRQWWWDGSRWRDTQLELPPDVMLAEDGRTWWDGVEWRAVPALDAETTEPRAEAPAAPPALGA
ncbi:MAG TPA: hypothetical protein VNV42_07920 [Solirubrobacteraceae bacterium]|nr:hypothetical protein [Solirubrobacteraceae bacterium]